MMIWPAYINQSFLQVDPSSTDAASYYGPYNTLLNHAFPAAQGFEVIPMPHQGCDTSLLFAVKKHGTAVLFLDVRAPISAVSIPAPDIQEAVKAMSCALCKVPYRVKGVSAFGPRYVVYDYEYDAAANELDARAGVPAMVEDGEGERDVRTEEGAHRWRELARCVGAAVPEA